MKKGAAEAISMPVKICSMDWVRGLRVKILTPLRKDPALLDWPSQEQLSLGIL
jgi:hypothetical protein